jgi:HK97 family phage major capsid protein
VLNQRDRELGRTPPERRDTAVDEDISEFREYIIRGRDALRSEDRLMRAQAVGTGSAGGYLAPASFSDKFETMLKAYDGLFDAAGSFETATGSAFSYPILSDEQNAASVVTENSTTSNVDLTFAGVSFPSCPMWRSGVISSFELIADSKFDFASLIAQATATRFARGAGAAFVATLLSGAAAGPTTASATAIAGSEVWDLIGSLDAAYLPNAAFLMRPATLVYLRKLTGTSGNYLFPVDQDVISGQPTLAGFRVFLSPSMGAITSAQKSIAFGDLSKFLIRKVRDSLTVQSLFERYAEYGQIAFECHWRIDGQLLKSSTATPVVTLVQKT